VDVVALAAQVRTLFDLGRQVLKAGKHLSIEKPLTETAEQAERLIEKAARGNRVSMVDYTTVGTRFPRTRPASVSGMVAIRTGRRNPVLSLPQTVQIIDTTQ
jgi:hypothetical protein